MEDSYIKQNLNGILKTVWQSASNAGRSAHDIRIVAITKTAPSEVLPLLLDAGISDAGENRWQVARDKFEHPDASRLTWHFVGSLQTNKVKYIVPRFDWVHSVDSIELADALSHGAVKFERNLQILLQVNVAEEPQKHGFNAESCAEAVRRIQALPGLSLRGLMTMAPIVDRAEDARPVFRQLRSLLEGIRDDFSLEAFDQLSMGMSDDFAIAIEEGATMIRLGRSLVNPPTSGEEA